MCQKRIAVQSYCFRGFKDNNDVATLVRQCGISAIELCGVHVDFADPSCYDDVIDTYRSNGIDIVSIGVNGMTGNINEDTKHFEFAKAAGSSTIGVNFNPGIGKSELDTVCGLAADYSLKLAIHNHGGRHWLGNTQMLKHIFAMAKTELGLMLDTAWALDAREDPLTMIREFKDRLYGIHVKDFVFDQAGKPEDVVAGKGNLNLPEMFALLEEIGFSGNCIIEYEGDVDDPVPAISECVDAIKEVSDYE